MNIFIMRKPGTEKILVNIKLILVFSLAFSFVLFLSGCSQSRDEPPNASFTITSSNLEVTVDASESFDPDGNIISYDWNFGDDSSNIEDDGSDNGKQASHTYDSGVSYKIELTVVDDDGFTDSTYKVVSVGETVRGNEEPKASFTASPTSGRAPLEVNFDASDSYDSDGSISSYSWDFDDGSIDSGKNVTHTFDRSKNYTVYLTVEDDDGTIDSSTAVIYASSNQSPNANFTANPDNGEAPLEVSFDASESSDPDGTIKYYNWEFGDGSTGFGINVQHTFDDENSYMVKLTITDNEGSSDSTEKEIEVYSPYNEKPKADFSYLPYCGDAPLRIEFDATNSYDPDGSIVSYSWDFGDGAKDSGIKTSHTYEMGSYDVKLTVTDEDGASSSYVDTIWVK